MSNSSCAEPLLQAERKRRIDGFVRGRPRPCFGSVPVSARHETYAIETLRTHFKKGEHGRIIIVTDEQIHYDRLGDTIDSILPADVPIYAWNAGGRAGSPRSRPGPAGTPSPH